uniref:DNA topoisomerase (ATP-hydrolyzing) n=1 Tax=viral metagenome TaxID=1070528 RepID=A0A6C0CH40_9ZZZZ
MEEKEENPETEYGSLNDREHVLLRPDTYVGPIELELKKVNLARLFDEMNVTHFKIEEFEIAYNAGMERIFLEILSNAADNASKSRGLGIDPGKTSVTITQDTVIIRNEGRPVSTVWHTKDKAWIPSLIFFNLRAGSNFDDDKERKWAGRNGFGAKLAAIFSTRYQVICHNVKEGMRHTQVATKNLSVVEEPERVEIKKSKSGEATSFTEVSYSPDFKLFYTKTDDQKVHTVEGQPLTSDPLHCRLCWDANDGYTKHGHFERQTVEMYAALVLDFSFNCKIPIDFCYETPTSRQCVTFDARSMIDYVKCYLPGIVNIKSAPIIFEDDSTRCIIFDTPHNGYQQSFANGMPTRLGGIHVTAWLNAISARLKAEMATKEVSIDARSVKNHVTIFLSCYVVNPKFKDQTKERLTGPISYKATVDPNMLTTFKSWAAYSAIKNSVEARERTKISKAQGGKKTTYVNIEDVEDAGWAGTDKAEHCVGFVCEGLSAKPFFVNGLKYVKNGRDVCGCYPLRGKVLNTRKATTTEILDSDVVNDLVKFYGLDEKVDYTNLKNLKKLRYGKACIMADADVDGIHIKTLMINFFSRYKGLLESEFVTARLTPVITVTKSKDKKKFYSVSEYEKWKLITPDWKVWTMHYFKGLGSATQDMIKDAFGTPVDQSFQCSASDQAVLELAMGAKGADDRKALYRLLVDLPESGRIDSRRISRVEDVIYEELILYAIEANRRAIPCVTDGFKESFRQIAFSALNKKGNDFEGVEEFQGVVKNLTHYRHGPESMKGAIIGMAQDFPGSNNVPILLGEGNFGSRIGMGKDASAARYISCRRSPVLRKLIRPEDDVMLKHVTEKKETIGVEVYYPILPIMLLNRCKGMGWGWSTDSPNYNPMHLIEWIRYFIVNVKDGNPSDFKPPPLLPWYRGYKGILFRRKDGKILNRGFFEMKGTSCHIYDLPITMSGKKYQKHLDKMVEEEKIQDYKATSVDSNRPSFVLRGCAKDFKRHRDLGIEQVLVESNLVFIGEDNVPRHYHHGAAHVMMNWCKHRYEIYVKRKDLYMAKMREELRLTLLRMKFVEDCLPPDKDTPAKFDQRAKEDEYILEFMQRNGYPMEFLSMALSSLSRKKVEELRKKCDKLIEEIERYECTHPGDLWLQELEELRAELENIYPGQWEVLPGYGTKEMPRPY